MGRKPKYENPEDIIQSFYKSVSDAYNSPGEGEQGREGKKKHELLAEEFGISRIKVRKILVTTGDVAAPQAIKEMMAGGQKIDEIAQKLNMSKSTVNSWVGYSKGVYGLDVSAAADRTHLYRARKQVIEELKNSKDSVTLWKAVCLFAGYPFQTAGRKTKDGVRGQEKFKYVVSEPGGAGGRRYAGEEVEGYGNEIFVNGREKGISRSSVDYAFKIATTSTVPGPKALKIYGSSYVYALFVRFGLITSMV